MSRRLSLFLFALVGFSAAAFAASATLTGSDNSSSAGATRSFEFTYQVHFPATENPDGPVRLWIPLPQADGYQDVSSLRVESPVAYTQGRDSEYKNNFAEFKPTAQQAAAGFDVTLSFTATRHEHKVILVGATANNVAVSSSDPTFRRYLEPDKLVPLNGTIAELAKEHTAGDTTQIEKARHIYEYVVATMRYDKTGEGWGRGDAVWACTAKRGNCTDFHSLFIGMMRSSGIPARFEIGFPIQIGRASCRERV